MTMKYKFYDTKVCHQAEHLRKTNLQLYNKTMSEIVDKYILRMSSRR
jgi:hypothetical protein